MPTAKTRDPDWVRDELILALDLYLHRGRKQLEAEDSDVIRLSELLNGLPIHPLSVRTPRFRNVNGVSMKLGNFLRIDPLYKGVGLSRGNRNEQEIWNEFANAPERLAKAVAMIKSKNPNP